MVLVSYVRAIMSLVGTEYGAVSPQTFVNTVVGSIARTHLCCACLHALISQLLSSMQVPPGFGKLYQCPGKATQDWLCVCTLPQQQTDALTQRRPVWQVCAPPTCLEPSCLACPKLTVVCCLKVGLSAPDNGLARLSNQHMNSSASGSCCSLSLS